MADNQKAAGRRILVVEDEFLVALHIEQAVRELGCLVVGPAARLQEALLLIENSEIDAAILDVSLRNGERAYPVADMLRQRGIPFLFTTAYGREGLDLPYANDAVLKKPFSQDELEDAIRQLADGGF